MFISHIALVSTSNQVKFEEVTQISASLQKQLTRDFGPIWNNQATVDSFKTLKKVPSGYWPIIIKDNIKMAGAAGVHMDRNGQPYALVQASGTTALTCSHECLEMLADPFGNRLVSSNSIKPGQGRVRYLVEVCDPCEGEDYAYSVNGIKLSDFYTPKYFDPIKSAAVQYSFTGAIKEPRQILKDGYLSWMIPETGEWWQAVFFDSEIEFRSLGVLAKKDGKSWREILDSLTFEPVEKSLKKNELTSAKSFDNLFISKETNSSSEGWANTLENDIEKILDGLKK